MRAILETAFTAAFWFADKASGRDEYLQPQKLQRLLFLAQACHAALYPGRTLMPAVFVADDAGPVEPNVYRSFSLGRPDIGVDAPLPDEAETLLEEIWRRFGHLSCDHLGTVTREMPAYANAHRRGARTEITLDAMRRSIVDNGVPGGGDPLGRRKVMRTQSGKHVRVRSWTPGAAAEGATQDGPDGGGGTVMDGTAALDWLSGNTNNYR